MTALHEVQRRFRDAVLHDASVPAEILGGRVTAAARLSIYHNNVFGNLTEALRLTYPAVQRLVGKAFFAAAASRFIAAHPPASPDLYEYGADFPAFLAGLETAATLAYLPDVARLEWAVCRALHTPLAPALDPTEITDPDQVLAPHPTLALLDLPTPARAIWEAVLSEDADDRAAALSAIDPAAPGEPVAVLCPVGVPMVRVLSPAGFALAAALAGGARLSDALASVPADQAPALLGALLTGGFFGHASREDAPEPSGAPHE